VNAEDIEPLDKHVQGRFPQSEGKASQPEKILFIYFFGRASFDLQMKAPLLFALYTMKRTVCERLFVIP
jgi:hypothetical protein